MTDRDTVLVIDDNERLAATLRSFVEERGYGAVAAHTGRDGLRALREHPVSLILLDLLLPDVDGISVLREAQRIAPTVDVIIVTGHATLDSAVAAVEAGAAGYVLKPLDLARLGALVDRTLERQRLQRENVRLQAEAAERLREAEALLEISGALTSALDLPEALRRCCRTLARLTGVDTAAAYLHDRETDLLHPVAGYHVPQADRDGVPIPVKDQGFSLPVWESRRPVWSVDIPGDPRFARTLFRSSRPASGVLLPLMIDDEVAGAFYLVWWKESRRLAERELGLLEHVSRQASLLLRNVRLYTQGEADRRRLQALHEVSRKLAEVHDADEVLSLIVAEATRLLAAEAAGIRLLEGDELVAVARSELAMVLMSRLRIKVGESLSGRVVATGEPIAVEDMGEDTRHDMTHKQAALRLGFHSYLGVPMRARGRTLGALNVYARARRRFSPGDVGLLSSFADQASLAIEKARLLRETQAGRELLERLHGVVLAMQESAAPADRVQAFARAVREVIGFDRAAVFLASADGAALTLAAVQGEGAEVPPTSLPVSPAAGPLYEVLRTRRPLAVLSAEALAAAPPLDPGRLAHPFLRTARFVVAPIMVGEVVIGVATADNKPSRRPIPPASVGPFGLLCQQLGAVLHEARLYEETRTQHARLAQILESTSDGVMLVGRHGRIEAANRRAGEMLGFEPAEVVGVGLDELLTGYRSLLGGWEEARAALMALLGNPERGGEGDLELQPRQRTIHWVGRPTRDASGATVGLTLTLNDVTQEREVSRMKSDFVSFVTHQLRTPLAGMRWLLELALQEPGVPEETGSMLRDAQEANQRLISLVNDLLDVSRLESGKLSLSPEATDLGQMTRSVLDELAPLARNKRHRVELAAGDGLPSVMVDPGLMRQAVLNLLSNAVKYTPAGGEIQVSIVRAGVALLWAVRDSGIGIPAESQGRLFEKFYRADNAVVLETEGTGLGLYLVRLIVERSRGRVWCESEPGRGSVFKFTIPLIERG